MKGRKDERWAVIRQQAMKRLKAVSDKYKKEQKDEPEEWWSKLPQDNEIRIP